uniref:Smad nuclear-interacting protein-like protein n=1 Tax=Glyptapanteles indiensis TaxID=92994 RepID=B7S904_GLYIN|nr:smad nuclear-interacting protein-like protein [Glyptapanteles indiensis]
MAGHGQQHRDRYRRKDSRDDYEQNNRRERTNKDRYHEKNERHENHRTNEESSPPRERQRPRERSRSRHRDERKGSRFENRRNDRRDRNHDRSSNNDDGEAGNLRPKREPSPDWGRSRPKDEDKPKPVDKEKPNFELSGKLTEDTNTINGIVIKYSEPDDAKKPKRRWRLYPFKGEKALPFIPVHRQSAYLLGRDRKVADIPLDHPSCSKQHAALQYRLVTYEREPGSFGKRVRPYLIDLESANGTTVNNIKLEAKRFHELLERDVIKFGFSSREYVLLHEHSKDDEDDDDVDVPNDT